MHRLLPLPLCSTNRNLVIAGAGRNPQQSLLGSSFPGRARGSRQQCPDNQLHRQQKMSLPFCHPNLFPVQLWHLANIRAQASGLTKGSHPISLGMHWASCTTTSLLAQDRSPFTHAGTYSLPLEDILSGISQCLCFLFAV